MATTAKSINTTQLQGLDSQTGHFVLADGQEIGHYHVECMHSVTEWLAIYSAWDSKNDRRVAIKIPRAGVVSNHDLLREDVRKAGFLVHSAICPVFHLLKSSSFTAVASGWVEGVAITELLSSRTFDQAVMLVRRLVSALNHAHFKGCVHGGLAPEQVVATADGIQILGFGLARSLPGCSARFSAPELATSAQSDARTDIYSLGVLIGDILLPHAEHIETEKRSRLQVLISKMTSERPSERPHSLNVVSGEIELILSSRGLGVDSVGAATQAIPIVQDQLTKPTPRTTARKSTDGNRRRVDMIRTMVEAGKYSLAVKRLHGMVATSNDPRLVKWARGKIDKLAVEVKNHKASRGDVFSTALDLYKRHDYRSAIQLLETIPDELHTVEMAQLYRTACEVCEEIKLLTLRIDSEITSADYRFLPDLERLLELKPSNGRYQRLHAKIRKDRIKARYAGHCAVAASVLTWIAAAGSIAAGLYIGAIYLTNNKSEIVETPSIEAPVYRPSPSIRQPVAEPSQPIFEREGSCDPNPMSSAPGWVVDADRLSGPTGSILWTKTSISVRTVFVKAADQLNADLIFGATAKWGLEKVADGVRIRLSSEDVGSIEAGGGIVAVPPIDLSEPFTIVKIQFNDDSISILQGDVQLACIDRPNMPVGFCGLVGGSTLDGLGAAGLSHPNPASHEVARFEGCDGRVLTSDNRRVVLREGNAVSLYDWERQQLLCKVPIRGSLRIAALINNGEQLLLITDSFARSFHTSGKLAREFRSVPRSYEYMTLSPNGSTLSCSDGIGSVVTVSLHNDKVEGRARKLGAVVRQVRSVDSTGCAFIGKKGATVDIYNTNGKRRVQLRPRSGSVSDFYSNGRNIVVVESSDGDLEAWRSSGTRIGPLTTSRNGVSSVTFDGVGAYALAAHTNGEHSLWSIATRSLEHSLPPSVKHASLIHRSGYLASVHQDGCLRIWKLSVEPRSSDSFAPPGSDGRSPMDDPGDYKELIESESRTYRRLQSRIRR